MQTAGTSNRLDPIRYLLLENWEYMYMSSSTCQVDPKNLLCFHYIKWTVYITRTHQYVLDPQPVQSSD